MIADRLLKKASGFFVSCAQKTLKIPLPGGSYEQAL